MKSESNTINEFWTHKNVTRMIRATFPKSDMHNVSTYFSFRKNFWRNASRWLARLVILETLWTSSGEIKTPRLLLMLQFPFRRGKHFHFSNIEYLFSQQAKASIKLNEFLSQIKNGLFIFYRYLKYLTKKYLKKNLLRDTLRVISTSREGYELRYFQIGNEADEDEEDNE